MSDYTRSNICCPYCHNRIAFEDGEPICNCAQYYDKGFNIHHRCSTCNGSGEAADVNGVYHLCPDCGGSGGGGQDGEEGEDE